MLALVGLLPLGALVATAALGLPAFGAYPGPYGDAINHTAVPLRHILNAISAVNFDYRGFDTLGEEFILFVGVSSLAVILAPKKEAPKRSVEAATGRPVRPTSLAARLAGHWLSAFTLLFGLYLILHVHLSPGGGFQGGVVVASAWLTVFLALGARRFHASAPEPVVESAEAIGVGGYVATGLLAAMAGGAFLQNVLPLGKPGALMSSGMILVLNACIGLAVGAGFITTAGAFEQALDVTDPDEGGPP
jgi:multicomponent Na+:H+ antiporter subunit B